MILVDFRPWHAIALGPRNIEWGPELTARANAAMIGGPALTLLGKDKSIIACFGLVLAMSRTAEVWALVGEDAKSHALSIHKAAVFCLEEAHKRYKIQRFQAAISEERPTARKWALRLGFKPESQMPKFGNDGETFIRYVRYF